MSVDPDKIASGLSSVFGLTVTYDWSADGTVLRFDYITGGRYCSMETARTEVEGSNNGDMTLRLAKHIVRNLD